MKYTASIYVEVKYDPKTNKKEIYLTFPSVSTKVAFISGDDVIYDYSFQTWGELTKYAVVEDHVCTVRNLEYLDHILGYLIRWNVKVIQYYDSSVNEQLANLLKTLGIEFKKLSDITEFKFIMS